MKRKRELEEIILDIRNEIPGFNKEELIEYTECAIPALYNSLKNEEKIKVKCNPKLVNKLNKEKAKYRINKNIDKISVQYIELFDSIKKDNEIYIQLYLSIYFCDNTRNNLNYDSVNDRYWNDIWIVTYKESAKRDKINSNCSNCGAIMKYNQAKDIFKCEYCGNIIHNNYESNWEIDDIEIVN